MLPSIANVASALEAMKAETLDEGLLNAAMADARETFRRAAEVECGRLRRDGTVGKRTVCVETDMGWVRVAYPYAPGVVTARDAVALLCGPEQGVAGYVKATRGARRRIARLGVTVGSYGEATEMLRETFGMAPSKETVRQIVNEVGLRTQEAVFAGALPRLAGPKWTPPKGAIRVALTMVISPDGTCFPCAKVDLAGRNGRNGGEAKGRNVNVVCIGKYEWTDASGRPLMPPGTIQYYVLPEGGEEFGNRLWELAIMEGVLEVSRVEFVSDGEKELESAFQTHFAALPNVSRALDAMHACGYVDKLVKALETDPSKVESASKRLRRRLVNAGWKGFLESLSRRYGKGVTERLEGEVRTAWNYLLSRDWQMNYQNLRRRRMVIGSGMAEVGCKLTVGGRLKGPGMHWRFKNGVRVALIRGMIRSRREFAV